jgi:hypothetical protein|eukprot:COSAG06_NODE_280_length_18452_cov_26.989660_10_plen_67_part_00
MNPLDLGSRLTWAAPLSDSLLSMQAQEGGHAAARCGEEGGGAPCEAEETRGRRSTEGQDEKQIDLH